jgi:hypothetical protein
VDPPVGVGVKVSGRAERRNLLAVVGYRSTPSALPCERRRRLAGWFLRILGGGATARKRSESAALLSHEDGGMLIDTSGPGRVRSRAVQRTE